MVAARSWGCRIGKVIVGFIVCYSSYEFHLSPLPSFLGRSSVGTGSRRSVDARGARPYLRLRNAWLLTGRQFVRRLGFLAQRESKDSKPFRDRFWSLVVVM